MYYPSSEKLDRMYEQSKINIIPAPSEVRQMIAELREHRAARWSIESGPTGRASDNAAVDRFAKRMKAKLARAREKGRGGWDDPAQCSPEKLSAMLHDHVAKGDPVDVANFAMMIEHYGATIATRLAMPTVEQREAFAQSQADHWLEDMDTTSRDAKRVSLLVMARNCIRFGAGNGDAK